jgi:diaminohydroxyphosphoribosylaminopyrimidine deaminase / 5-amino-6-(5-phosphoribosylamino)uracil reductase
LLRSAGVSVRVGEGGAEAHEDHLGHILRVREGRPMVTLKLAQTADGYCAPADGSRMQISGEAAMREVHLLRASHDAIMVGIGTVLADDPQLTVRLTGLEDRSPLRVVLDSGLRLPLTSALVRTASAVPVIVIAAADAPAEPEFSLRERGIDVFRVGRDASGHLDLLASLRLLAVRGITRVFSEGGPIVAEALAHQGLADRLILSTADHALGEPGTPALRQRLRHALADPARFRLQETARHGSDVFSTYRRVA